MARSLSMVEQAEDSAGVSGVKEDRTCVQSSAEECIATDKGMPKPTQKRRRPCILAAYTLLLYSGRSVSMEGAN